MRAAWSGQRAARSNASGVVGTASGVVQTTSKEVVAVLHDVEELGTQEMVVEGGRDRKLCSFDLCNRFGVTRDVSPKGETSDRNTF